VSCPRAFSVLASCTRDWIPSLVNAVRRCVRERAGHWPVLAQRGSAAVGDVDGIARALGTAQHRQASQSQLQLLRLLLADGAEREHSQVPCAGGAGIRQPLRGGHEDEGASDITGCSRAAGMQPRPDAVAARVRPGRDPRRRQAPGIVRADAPGGARGSPAPPGRSLRPLDGTDRSGYTNCSHPNSALTCHFRESAGTGHTLRLCRTALSSVGCREFRPSS
jgi:hypothetical protein